MPIEDLKASDVPFDRLTLLCKVMTDALEQNISEERRDLILGGLEDPEQVEERSPDVRGIIFLSDAHKSGIQMFGYEETSEGLSELLVHMKAMFQSMGKGFGVMTDQGVMLMEEG